MGCGIRKHTPPELVAKLEYGTSPDDYKEIIEAHMQTVQHLDAYEIISEKPTMRYARKMLFWEDLPKCGWAVDVKMIVRVYESKKIGYETNYTRKGKPYRITVYGDPVDTGRKNTTWHRLYILDGVVAGEEGF